METAFFHLGPISVYRFGLTLGLSYLAGGLVGRRFAIRLGISPTGWWWLVFSLMIATLAGARFVDILPDIGYYVRHPGEIWRLPVEGLSFHGGMVGSGIVLALAVPRLRRSFWELADLLALPYLAGAVTAAVVWGAPIPRAASYAASLLDLVYLTGMYALTWWTWMKRSEVAFAGEAALFVVTCDGVLRLGLALASLPLFGVDWASMTPVIAARLGVTALAGVALVAKGAAGRLLAPLVEPFRRPLSRWFGWLVAYGFLVAVALAVRS